MSTEAQAAPAGWYDDGTGKQRWWDGTAWGDYAPVTTIEWPHMPIPKKERAALDLNLGGEPVLGSAVGIQGQTVVATPTQLVIVKTGAGTGRGHGSSVVSFAWSSVVGVNVGQRSMQGELEVLTAASGKTPRSNVKKARAENMVLFRGKEATAAFTAFAVSARRYLATR